MNQVRKLMARVLSEIERPSYQRVKNVLESYQIDRASVRQILGISESTQFRYERKNPILKPNLADRWTRFERVLQQAEELFEDKSETQRWLSTPKKALEDKTPLEVLGTDAGCRRVEQILMQAAYGVFT